MSPHAEAPPSDEADVRLIPGPPAATGNHPSNGRFRARTSDHS